MQPTVAAFYLEDTELREPSAPAGERFAEVLLMDELMHSDDARELTASTVRY